MCGHISANITCRTAKSMTLGMSAPAASSACLAHTWTKNPPDSNVSNKRILNSGDIAFAIGKPAVWGFVQFWKLWASPMKTT